MWLQFGPLVIAIFVKGECTRPHTICRRRHLPHAAQSCSSPVVEVSPAPVRHEFDRLVKHTALTH